MSTSTAPAPATNIAPTATPEMVKAWAKVLSKEGEAIVARDAFCISAKTAATKHSWNQKQLTAALMTLPNFNAPRTSEIVKFVFPANPENRAVLDKIVEKNANTSGTHARIGKPVMLAVARSTTPITIEEATAQVQAAKTRQANPPGGGTTTTPTKKLTPQEQSDNVQTAIVAAMKLAAGYGFDAKDYQQESDAALEKFKPFGDAKPDDDEEAE